MFFYSISMFVLNKSAGRAYHAVFVGWLFEVFFLS